MVLGTPPARALHRLGTAAHHQSFCEEGLSDCPRALTSGAGFMFGIYLVAYGAPLKEHRCGCHLGISLCLPPAHQYHIKINLIPLPRAPVFAIAVQDAPPDCLPLVVNGVYACGPTGLCIFAYI